MLYKNNIKLSIYGFICLIISLVIPFYNISPFMLYSTYLWIPLLIIIICISRFLIDYIYLHLCVSPKSSYIFKRNYFYILDHQVFSLILTVIPILFLFFSIMFKFYLDLDYTNLFIVSGLFNLIYHYFSYEY